MYVKKCKIDRLFDNNKSEKKNTSRGNSVPFYTNFRSFQKKKKVA